MCMKSDTHKLLQFLAITFIFSWVFWIPKALLGQGVIQPSALTNVLEFLNLGAFGPMVGAFVVTYMHDGWVGLKKLLKRAVSLNFNKKWLLPTLLLMPAIAGGALLIVYLLGNEIPALPLLTAPHLIIYWFVSYSCLVVHCKKSLDGVDLL